MKKRHYKLPLLLVASTTLVTPLMVCAKSVDANNDARLNVIKYDKVIFKSNVSTAKFDGDTVIKVKRGTYFAGIIKPTVEAEGYSFDGWYKESTFTNQWHDTDKIQNDTVEIWAKLVATADYALTIDGISYQVTNPEALCNNTGTSLTLSPVGGGASRQLSPADWKNNMPLTIGKEVTSIGDNFLKGFNNFNSDISFVSDSKCAFIGDNFVSGLNQFNGTVTLPNSLKGIGFNFLKGNTSFGANDTSHSKTITLPNSLNVVRGGFLADCPSFCGTIAAQENQATVFEADQTTLTYNGSDGASKDCYTKGIKITGTHKEYILTRLAPIAANNSWRNTIGSTFEDCTWTYLSAAASIYEASAPDTAADNTFLSRFQLVDGSTPTSFDDLVGLEKKVKVNEVEHIVRVIGYKHDTIAAGQPNAGKKTALTFEFKNVISDSEGYGLATLWFDTADSSTEKLNKDYLNSTIRYNLTHSGNPTGYRYWFRKDATTHSTDSYCWDSDSSQSKSVLDMISDNTTGTPDLAKALKFVNKQVAMGEEYTITTYQDKLFLPTARELSASTTTQEEGTAYKFYGGSNGDDDASRKKSQVNGLEYYNSSLIEESDKTSSTQVENYAAYNEGGGNWYWLSSPDVVNKNSAKEVGYGGDIGSIFDSNHYAMCIAPAFCI